MRPLTRRDTLALLTALSLFLSAIEYLVPKPIPFMRIGLANLSLLIALEVLNKKDFLLLTGLKILLQGLLYGTLFSPLIILSLGGSLSGALTMLLLHRTLKKHISMIGISLAGALVNNSIQVLLAGVMVFGKQAFYLFPPFLIVGTISSLLLGLFADIFISRSRWVLMAKGLKAKGEQ